MAPEIVVSKILNIYWLIGKRENLASQEDKENKEGNAQIDIHTNSHEHIIYSNRRLDLRKKKL